MIFLLSIFYYVYIISVIVIFSDFYYFPISRESDNFGKKIEFYYFSYYWFSMIFYYFYHFSFFPCMVFTFEQ